MMLPPQWLAMLQQQLQAWSRQRLQSHHSQDGGHADAHAPWPLLRQWKWKWPWQAGAEHKQKLQDEIMRRRQQIEALRAAVKAESAVDLQDVLCAMVMSECVYKRPEADVVRAVNKFKSDFGGQLVSLQRIQASLDHVPHQYLLAETDNTLYASFVGTKAYKDVIADASFLQRALFYDDPDSQDSVESDDDWDADASKAANRPGTTSSVPPSPGDTGPPPLRAKPLRRSRPKPAAHGGFLARAKGIPALEIYRLAQKKDQRLVLCGHSLGGAVAVLATLAILRVCTSSSTTKAGAKLPQIKCITFSQPPVGNPALRDYVHRKGWQRHFRTYCIPEDVVPRILSPAYFQHFRTQAELESSQEAEQTPAPPVDSKENLIGKVLKGNRQKPPSDGGSERMALGLGPVQLSIWRLPRLVPLAGIQKWLPKRATARDSATTARGQQPDKSHGNHGPVLPAPLEIKEGDEGIALTPLIPSPAEGKASSSVEGRKGLKTGAGPDWRRRVPVPQLPQLPAYVPFGELYLLERSSVEPLSASEYTKLTSVQSVLLELKGRFQSHTMKSYRSRFQRIFDLCMSEDFTSLPMRMEHLPHLPHLQQWFGLLGAGFAEAGVIAEPLAVHSATALVPLGWSESSGKRKTSRPLLVDVQGYGLHLCTLVQAQVNGRWCATVIETPPSAPSGAGESPSDGIKQLQKMQIRIGPPLQKSPHFEGRVGSEVSDYVPGVQTSLDLIYGGMSNVTVQGLESVIIYCSTDFMTAAKGVALRLRRVRLLGLDGAGKSSLHHALLGRPGTDGGGFADTNAREGVNAGVHYVDAAGVNLQNLEVEARRLRQELHVKVGEHRKKLDLVILVHNLAHKIPYLRNPAAKGAEPQRPALSVLLDELVTAGIPLVLAITNKFAVSADQRQAAAAAVMDTYQVPPTLAVVVNSCPYRRSTVKVDSDDESVDAADRDRRHIRSRLTHLSTPISLVQLPFRRRNEILPAHGVNSLQDLIHSVLLSTEEAAREDLLREVAALEMANKMTIVSSQAKPGQAAAAAVGAALGAGMGVFIAILLGAANSLRKP